MRYATPTTLTLILAAGLLSACDRSPLDPAGVPKPKSEQVASAQAPSIPSGIVNDASVPPADEALAKAPTDSTDPTKAARPTGQDTKATQSDLTKQEETKTMPKAMHGNNHSSPSNEGATSKP